MTLRRNLLIFPAAALASGAIPQPAIAEADGLPEDEDGWTLDAANAMTFEPWPASFEAEYPLRAALLLEAHNAYGTMRVAVAALTKTKEQLIAALKAEPEAHAEFVECLGNTADWLETHTEAMKCAHARLFVAGMASGEVPI